MIFLHLKIDILVLLGSRSSQAGAASHTGRGGSSSQGANLPGAARASGGSEASTEVLAKATSLVARGQDLGRAVGSHKRSRVRGEVGRVDAATNQGRVGAVLGSQTGQEERDLGGLGVSGETDEGTGDGILEAVGPLCPGLGAADLGVGVVAGGLGEAGGLGADLLDGSAG